MAERGQPNTPSPDRSLDGAADETLRSTHLARRAARIRAIEHARRQSNGSLRRRLRANLRRATDPVPVAFLLTGGFVSLYNFLASSLPRPASDARCSLAAERV